MVSGNSKGSHKLINILANSKCNVKLLNLLTPQLLLCTVVDQSITEKIVMLIILTMTDNICIDNL